MGECDHCLWPLTHSDRGHPGAQEVKQMAAAPPSEVRPPAQEQARQQARQQVLIPWLDVGVVLLGEPLSGPSAPAARPPGERAVAVSPLPVPSELPGVSALLKDKVATFVLQVHRDSIVLGN